MRLRLAVLHTSVRLGARRTNARRLSELINKAISQHNVDTVILPSYPLSGPVIGYYSDSRVRQALRSASERIPSNSGAYGQSLAILVKWSIEYRVGVIAGPIIERAGPRLYLTVVHVSPEGRVIGKYRKMALTREEISAGISPGKAPTIFLVENVNARVGIFVEEDLAFPEIFRFLQSVGANIIVGFMLPYNSPILGPVKEYSSDIITMDLDSVSKFLSVRSRETGLPILLVGGGVESSEPRGSMSFMPTIPVEPESGVIGDRIRGLEDLGSYLIVEVDTMASKPRPLPDYSLDAIKNLCRGYLGKAPINIGGQHSSFQVY